MIQNSKEKLKRKSQNKECEEAFKSRVEDGDSLRKIPHLTTKYSVYQKKNVYLQW